MAPDQPASDEFHDVALAARGDEAAFERLYRRCVPRIHTLARRMAGEEEADDLTQEIFFRAWQKLGTFRGESGFSTWLHRLAVNLILSRREPLRRRRQRFLRGEGVQERARAATVSPGSELDLESGIQSLPEGARRIFVLYDVEGFSHEEIAQRVGISVGTSKSQLHRARMMLRSYLG